MNYTIKIKCIPYYLLVASLFLGNFIFQYAALTVAVLWISAQNRIHFRRSSFIQLPILLFVWSIISYLVNLLTGSADVYSILFWAISYFPPFLLMWLILFDSARVDFHHIFVFYKALVYIQVALLIYDAIALRTLVVGDKATGTVGDANWVALHVGVVIIYQVIRLIDQSEKGMMSFSARTRSIFEICFLFLAFVIPESTANLGILAIVLGVLFFRQYVRTRFSPVGMLSFIVLAILGLVMLSGTIIYRRISGAVIDIVNDNTNSNPNLFKLSMYRKVISGDLFAEANFLYGSGPATFTSRSSVVRMPEERINDLPFELPYFKSDVFAKHISPVYAEWRASGESYGNFASPQTQVISVIVELGIVGLGIFAMFFLSVLRSLRREVEPSHSYLLRFGRYLTFFFLISLFHLNFWEYPIESFTYVLLVCLVMRTANDAGPLELARSVS